MGTRRQLRDVGLVIVAAGSGRRFGGAKNKLLVHLDGRPVLIHSLSTFCPHLPPGHTVLVLSREARAGFTRALSDEGLQECVRIAIGGAERQDSVLAGLECLPPSAQIAAIHDAARPRASLNLLLRCVESARAYGSGIAAVRMRDTVKRVDPAGMVVETIDRRELCATETPQVFRRELILTAYRQVITSGRKITDDAQAVELLGKPIHLVIHEDDNRKITLPADLS